MIASPGHEPNEQPGAAAATSVRRLVNDEILNAATRLDPEGNSMFEFLCECGDLNCHGIVRMTLAEYATTEPGSVRVH